VGVGNLWDELLWSLSRLLTVEERTAHEPDHRCLRSRPRRGAYHHCALEADEALRPIVLGDLAGAPVLHPTEGAQRMIPEMWEWFKQLINVKEFFDVNRTWEDETPIWKAGEENATCSFSI
jgi:hypothetical protein